MKEKEFYPWTQHKIEDWIKQHRVKVVGEFIKDHYPRGSRKPSGKKTIIYYEDLDV